MKLIRFGEKDKEKPGVFHGDKFYDVSALFDDYNESFFEDNGPQKLTELFRIQQATLPVVPNTVRLGAPVARPSKIICVGLNYSDHAAEGNMKVPTEPVIFFKSTTAICGPFDDLVIPKGSLKTDWEVELAIVIGHKARYVGEREAVDYIAGYCLHNDYSERSYQLEREGQWVKGKSCDTFAPLGPWLALKDEMPDTGNLHLWLKVNGKMFQDGNTQNLIFNVPYLVHYISQFMTLLPGDIISTGTPAGVGLGQKPPVYIKEGDEIELGIDGLGVSRQRARAFS
jgi:2-keto-4-pentenoate hydratase/2-oxohepta-3-ene-1,7-dioic acid hydratase in catechol pathway